MKIRIIFPTRGRKEKFNKTFNLYHSLQDNDNKYFVICDYDDEKKPDEDKRYTLDVGMSFGKIHAINRGVKYLQDDDWDIILLASDDMIPQVKGWDSIIINKMKEHYPDTDGVLWFYDGYRNKKDNLNTLVCMGRKYFNRFDFIYNPCYETFYCDNEFQAVATLLGKQKYFEQVIIKHEHGGVSDETGKKNEFFSDLPTFESRKKNNFNIKKGKYIKPNNIHLYSEFRLGDNIFTIRFLKTLSDENPNDTYYLYVQKKYLKALALFVGEKYGGKIVLSCLTKKPGNAINTWIGEKNFFQKHKLIKQFNLFYEDYFKMFCLLINRKFPKDYVFFDKEDKPFVFPYYDILIVNSFGESSQVKDKKLIWQLNRLVCELKRYGLKVITTEKIKDIWYEDEIFIPIDAEIACTRDSKFSLFDIKNLSKNVKAIIGVNTAPLVATFNEKNKEKYYAVIDKTTNYTFAKKIETIEDIIEVKKDLIKICSDRNSKDNKKLKLMVGFAVYNRPLITKICLNQLSKIVEKKDIFITDDGSSNKELKSYLGKFPNVIFQKNKGVDRVRLAEMKRFCKSEYDLFYITDNDAFLDPSAIEIMKWVYNETRLPVSCYNSIYFRPDHIKEKFKKYTIINACAGISMLFDKQMVDKILKTRHDRKKTMWDVASYEILGGFAITNISYVQHYGKDGLHFKTRLEERALNTSEYLQIMDCRIMKELND